MIFLSPKVTSTSRGSPMVFRNTRASTRRSRISSGPCAR
jgi:hypothetical protein